VRVGIWVNTGEAESRRVFPVDEVARRIERAEELGFDSAWIMDHPFVETPIGRLSGHDPMVVLAHAAARTRRIRLGTLVACTAFRPPGQLAREAAALADAAGGRFVLGLGAGWHRPEFEAFDYPFDHLVSRFEEQATAIRRLLAGERVTLEGRYVRLREAEVFATAPPPPLWIAAGGPRMLGITARLADGWNLAWGGLDPSWLAEKQAALERELVAAGRDRASFTVSAGVAWVPDENWDALTRSLRAYEAAGVDLVILCLADGPLRRVGEEDVERAAGVLSGAGLGSAGR
jgi:alkanesulfonate monooxygenase SsuD/methylene tetrahydromethanopterin reductase-like flavin-dependent oxidoreductase (luciferase family)